jgi:arylformamidase
MAAAWPRLARAPISVPGRHHFDVVEEIGRHGTAVFDAVLRLGQVR